jgi:hypothetical protein
MQIYGREEKEESIERYGGAKWLRAKHVPRTSGF